MKKTMMAILVLGSLNAFAKPIIKFEKIQETKSSKSTTSFIEKVSRETQLNSDEYILVLKSGSYFNLSSLAFAGTNLVMQNLVTPDRMSAYKISDPKEVLIISACGYVFVYDNEEQQEATIDGYIIDKEYNVTELEKDKDALSGCVMFKIKSLQ